MLARVRKLHVAHLRALAVAVLATVFSAGLAFAGAPPLPEQAGPGLANAGLHAGKTVPVRAGQQEPVTVDDEDGEDTDGEENEVEEVNEEAGENCATDPTALTDEELAELRHGSIVCWVAHQETWPEEFKNHGQWVSSWAKWKAPAGDEEATATATGNGKGKGNGKGRAGS